MKSTRYAFESTFSLGRTMRSFSEDEIRNEPMFFGVSPVFAHTHGGPITRTFVARFAEDHPELSEEHVVFDSKVAMLMPGWFPCIPGWHHDDVPRTAPDGQPNYDSPEYRSKHCMALVNGDICPTEFAVGAVDIFGVPDGLTIYRMWHEEIERKVASKALVVCTVPDGRLVYFDDRAFHRGVQATATGWRWFGRATWGTHRKILNQIRSQVQVYLAAPFDGW